MMYLIAGHAKTGTSMVANILHYQGAEMGDDFGDWFHHKENLAWIDAINGPAAASFLGMTDAAYLRWAVKHPSFAERIPDILADARHAGIDFRVIVPFRDSWATRAGLQKERETEISQLKRLQMLVKAAKSQHQLSESICKLSPIYQQKIYCFSYEKALIAPVAFFENLMTFCEIDYTTEQADSVARYIRPERGYLSIESWEALSPVPCVADHEDE